MKKISTEYHRIKPKEDKRMIKTWSTPVHDVKENVPCSLCGSTSFKPALNCEGYSFVRCKQCGLVQMNPQPTKEEITARYGTAHGNDYLDYELKNEDNFLYLQKLALNDAGFLTKIGEFFEVSGTSLSPLCPHSGTPLTPSFLDIGCATGALLAFMRDHGWNVTGVEISPSAEYARKHRNLDVRDIPLEENNFEKEQFDVIYASHLIEHLKDPRSFFEEVNRILKPTGSIYIATPNIAGLQAKLFGNNWRSAIFDHLFLFSRKTLTKLLKSTGFKVKKMRTWGGLAAGTAPKWLKKIVDKAAKLFGFGDVMIIYAVKK